MPLEPLRQPWIEFPLELEPMLLSEPDWLEPVLAWLEAFAPEDPMDPLELLVCATTHVAHSNSNNPDNKRFLMWFVFLLLGMWICCFKNPPLTRWLPRFFRFPAALVRPARALGRHCVPFREKIAF